jgi:hypothetical protein
VQGLSLNVDSFSAGKDIFCFYGTPTFFTVAIEAWHWALSRVCWFHYNFLPSQLSQFLFKLSNMYYCKFILFHSSWINPTHLF